MNYIDGRIEKRASELNITIPESPKPQGNYRPALVTGNLAFTSGMGPILDGVRRNIGYVGGDVTVKQAAESAKIATLNALGALRLLVGTLDKIVHIVKVTGYVRSAPGFCEQVAVLDAASDLLMELFGDAGGHVRSAIGVAELPFGIPVEIELIVQTNYASG